MKPASVVVLGTIRVSAPPLHEQRISEALSDDLGLSVLHIDPPLSPAVIARSRGRMRPFFAGNGKVASYSPLVLLPAERQRHRNARMLEAQVAWAARRLPAPRLVLDARLSPEIRTPWAAARVCVLKDHNPAGARLWNRDRHEIERTVLGALAAADRCYAVTESLAGWAAERGHPRCAVIPHGWAAGGSSGAPPPTELASIESPILLFAGRVDGRLDFRALERLADSGIGSVVTVGPWLPSARRDLAQHPHVHALAPVASHELTPYLEAADCLLLPYLSDEWSRYGLPAKLYEYLAAGPPIVASGYVSLGTFPHPLLDFSSDGDLVEATRGALAADDDAARTARRSCARSNPWSSRARDLLALVEDL